MQRVKRLAPNPKDWEATSAPVALVTRDLRYDKGIRLIEHGKQKVAKIYRKLVYVFLSSIRNEPNKVILLV